MTHVSRWLSTVLAVCILINTIPLASFAQESGEEALLLVEDSLLIEEESEPSEPASEPSESESKPSEPESEPSESASEPSESASESSEPVSESSEPAAASEEELVLAGETGEPDAPSYSDPAVEAFAQVLTQKGFAPSGILKEEADGTVTLTVGENGQQVLVLLSQQDASLYRTWTIAFSVSGSVTIPAEFQGLGSDTVPFAGKFTSSSQSTIVLPTTLFQALDAGAYLNNVNIIWNGPSSQPILANTLVVTDAEHHEIAMPLTGASSFSPYIGKLVKAEGVESAGVITLPALTYSTSEVSDSYPGHTGLACGEMGGGTKLKLAALKAPAISLKASADAGSLVGYMGAGAEFEISESESLALSATLTGQNVGGLVGSMDTNAKLTISNSMTLNTTVAAGSVNGGGLVGSLTKGVIQMDADVELTADIASNGSVTGAAGGIAGVAVTETGPLTSTGNVLLKSVTAHGANAGVLYGVCTVSGTFAPLNRVTLSPDTTYTVKGTSSGGVFGTLTLDGEGQCELIGSNTLYTTFPAGTTKFGGVVGTLLGQRKNALVIAGFTVSSEFTGGTDNSYGSYPTFYGGLAAIQGTDVTLDVKSTIVSINNVKTSSIGTNPKTSAYAGLTAYVSDGALLMSEDVTVKLSNYGSDHCGGGVAGYTGKGSIVYLRGFLDLSDCPLITKQNSGQIVAAQDCSLIYGPDLTLNRYKNGLQLDDIGNYGELYRVPGFLTIGEGYQHSFSRHLSGSPYTLSDAADYACLALAWQSRGAFATVDGAWSDIKTGTIQLAGNLDLRGMGIGGLSRDVVSDDDTFSGSLIGGGTIILDIGAANSANGVTKGDGRIYWHNAPGLFAVLSGGATVENLTLGGSIRISNERTTPMYCGALAARLNCNTANGTPLGTGVKTMAEMEVLYDGAKTLYVGGLIGNAYGTAATTLYLDGSQKAVITSTTSGNSSHFGGVIGAIEKSTPLSINCQGTMLGGGITVKNANDTLYAGALLGTAFPDATKAGIRTITLSGVTVDDFTLSGSAATRMSGILGGIWGNTDVAMDRLTINSAALNSSGTAKLGGLVYRASGKWTIDSVDLSGLAINASGGAALGLLVCQGGAGKETVNGSDQNVGGLYLEMTQHWNGAYTVPTLTADHFGGSVFDEFVAYSAYADGTANAPNYHITHSGSGIISLKTANDTVNMRADGERNTYVNRTDLGTAKQTNAYSRYYYNLPQVLTFCDGGAVDRAEELLIWSVCRYAESTLRTYFKNDLIDGAALAAVTTIGSETGTAYFDMEGLSYYPIRIVNSNITVKNANIQFHNKQIEDLEKASPENKSTRDSTQHYTMHCGLFLDFVADGTTGEDYTMNVNGVSFAGTVGKVNGQSGALVCGTVKGGQYSAKTSVCTVVLGESDHEANAVTLAGIQVDSTEEYRPVLIGSMGNHIRLKANYVTATQETEAGSSLIGDVGQKDAKRVSLEFAGTIRLPDTSGVFTRATLLNSLSYNIGSATYRFKKEKGNAVTLGYELGWNGDTPVSVEYAGKQGWYDGAPSGGSDDLKIRDNFDFSECLPYVWCSPVHQREGVYVSGMHELAVNIPSINLLDGCGTYGHPYIVNAEQLEVIATFINTGSATSDWQVRVPKSGDTAYHTEADQSDPIATYDSTSGWNVGDGVPDVRKHLATAYYRLVSDMELNDFTGIGTDSYAFAGVIDGNGKIVTLQGAKGSFINYSYGSVVRNLTIKLNQKLSIDSAAPKMGTDNATRVAEQAPSKFFGGVIGCVLGGDNIIDGVTVEGGNGIDAAGECPYLVPIGGFVGVIAGGGVIFRNGCTGGIAAADANQLYRNPIIGRVLGGFAFRETDDAIVDNGDKNYKINTLTNPSGSLSWDGDTLTVNNGEGLLVLSAIVSSGAGSSESNVYKKGTARLARYNRIGEPDGEADRNLDTGVPYLLSKTGIGKAEICGRGTEGIPLSFAKDAAFDMSGYGNGYRGLSARYVSNAGFVGSDLTPYTVVMRVKRFNGNGATVSGIHMQVKEYNNDDFHAASMGGIFNIVWTKQSSGGTPDSIFAQNLTLDSCTVTLDYVNNKGVSQKQADTATFKDNDGLSCVAVGGFAGSVSDIEVGISMSNKFNNYLLTELHVMDSDITGPNSAGGLIGATAMTNAGLTGCPGKLLSNSKYAQFGPSFLNCSYRGTNVTAKLAAGGMVGAVYANSSSGVAPQFRSFGYTADSDSPGCYATCSVTREIKLGANSEITTTALGGLCSGVFGTVGMRTRVNSPEANSKTGLQILTNGETKALKLSNVQMNAVKTYEALTTSAGQSNNADGAGTTAAAGCVGKIGYTNPVYFHNVELDHCTISVANTKEGYAGGIVASGYTNTTISVYDTAIRDTTIIGQNAGGLVGLVKQSGTSTLNAVNCVVLDSDIRGRTSAGGITGLGYFNSVFFNILIKDTSVRKINTSDAVVESDTKYAGRLIGQTGSTLMLSAAGISVVKTPGSNAVIPAWDVGSGTSGTATTNYGTGGYVAYADYSGLEDPANNPQFSLRTGDSTEKPLTSDAVGWEDTYGSIAARILEDHKEGPSGAPYPSGTNTPYTNNAAAIANTGWTPQVSTFQAEQKYSDEQWPYGDLPVLLLKGKASGRDDIVRYLNAVTNGAYSGADSRRVSVTTYSYDKDTHLFTMGAGSEPASVVPSVTGDFQVYKSRYDNTRDRFSLVEVMFTVDTKEAGKKASSYTYTVSVPVMVIRELQFVYSTTFSYGTEFYPAAYENLKYHVLESTDVPFSAYLTLQYNRDASQYSEYGWEDLINEGSDAFLKIDKILQFVNNGEVPMPVGTKLTLLDCQHGNKAYYYRVTDGAANIPFSSFTDSDGYPFQSSMADVLGVSCTPNNTSGRFVKTGKDDATVLLGGEYYRLWKESDPSDSPRFDLAVPDLDTENIENLPKENYLLVMEIPDQGENFSLNGKLLIALNDVIASTGTPVHRSPDATTDPGSNDEFSYLIFSGYRQRLESLNDPGIFNLPQNSGENDPVMRFSLQDTITFSNQQVYNRQDHLYLKFTATPQKHEGSQTEDCQFPAGTSGTVHFYVQNEDGKYFTLDSNGNWNVVPVDSKTEAVSYPWMSDGNNMELPLSRDGTNAALLGLEAVRQAVKGTTGDSSIIVTAEMEVDFSKLSGDAFEKTIPASENNGTDSYAQLRYQAQLSTQSASLDYSSARAAIEDPAKYYRAVKYQAILSMDAREINQLGVNPLAPEPQYLSNDKKTSRIDLTALLDLGDLENPDEVLRSTERITFKLYLERRQDTNGKLSYNPVPGSNGFLSFDDWQYQDNCWWRKILPSQFDGERFSMDITAHVSMLPRNFANYRIRLEAVFTGSSPAINSDEAYVVYTYACIDPAFYVPQGG